jgi:hypothetical protein
MNIPGFGFHPLRGKPQRYSVHVNGPWCITFEFDQGDAYRVDFESLCTGSKRLSAATSSLQRLVVIAVAIALRRGDVALLEVVVRIVRRRWRQRRLRLVAFLLPGKRRDRSYCERFQAQRKKSHGVAPRRLGAAQ